MGVGRLRIRKHTSDADGAFHEPWRTGLAHNNDQNERKKTTKTKKNENDQNDQGIQIDRSEAEHRFEFLNIHFSSIIIADEFGRNERLVLEHGIGPIFSPGRDSIAFSYESQLPGFGGDYDVIIYDLTKEIATPILPDPDTSDVIADWSPDGRYLLVHGSGEFGHSFVYLFDLTLQRQKKYWFFSF